MSDNTTRPDEKTKKNKNKKKKESNAVAGVSNPADILSQLNSLMNQEKPVDFEKFDECEKKVREEIESIQSILTNIQQNKFETFPDEPKKENTNPVNSKPELDAHRKSLLGELNKKILLFEERLQKLDGFCKEVETDAQMNSILQGIKDNLTDDIRRNKDLYRRFESGSS